MAHVYHPPTGRVKFSVSTPKFTVLGWIKLTPQLLEPVIGTLDPDDKINRARILATLRYWVWNGSAFRLMTQAEQDQADADDAASALVQAKARAHTSIDEVTAIAQQIRALASKTQAEIDASGVNQKAAVSAMTNAADVNAYEDPRFNRNGS